MPCLHLENLAPRALSLLAAAGLVTSCFSPPAVYLADNPEIRARQTARLARFLPTEADRQRIYELLGPRTAFIEGMAYDGESANSGRAACLTHDGYFLTANHVVEAGDPVLLETHVSPEIPPGVTLVHGEGSSPLIQTEAVRGRVVWRDPELDLAVLKFPGFFHATFDEPAHRVAPGAVVYAADDTGQGYLAADESVDSLVGNGPFLVAGHLKSVRPVGGSDQAVFATASLVTRGGMSGAPVATPDGRLVGIIVRVRINALLPGWSRAEITMLGERRLADIIEADRLRPGSVADKPG